MKPGQYSADCADYLRAGLLSSRTAGCRQELKTLIGELAAGVKFALPDKGRFFPDYERCRPPLRLPYPTVVLEFEADHTPMIVVASEVVLREQRHVHVSLISYSGSQAHWNLVNADFRISGDGEIAQWLGEMTVWNKPYQTAESRLHQGQFQKAFLSIILRTLGSFLAVFECSNVSPERVQADAFQNSKRLKRGKSGLSDYWVLTVPGASTQTFDAHGTHASPRQHLRRGHIRRLVSRTIWVNACVVGHGPGFVDKDYRVEVPA